MQTNNHYYDRILATKSENRRCKVAKRILSETCIGNLEEQRALGKMVGVDKSVIWAASLKGLVCSDMVGTTSTLTINNINVASEVVETLRTYINVLVHNRASFRNMRTLLLNNNEVMCIVGDFAFNPLDMNVEALRYFVPKRQYGILELVVNEINNSTKPIYLGSVYSDTWYVTKSLLSYKKQLYVVPSLLVRYKGKISYSQFKQLGQLEYDKHIYDRMSLGIMINNILYIKSTSHYCRMTIKNKKLAKHIGIDLTTSEYCFELIREFDSIYTLGGTLINDKTHTVIWLGHNVHWYSNNGINPDTGEFEKCIRAYLRDNSTYQLAAIYSSVSDELYYAIDKNNMKLHSNIIDKTISKDKLHKHYEYDYTDKQIDVIESPYEFEEITMEDFMGALEHCKVTN